MFDFKISKDDATIIERSNVVPQTVLAALQILGIGEVLTVSLSTRNEK